MLQSSTITDGNKTVLIDENGNFYSYNSIIKNVLSYVRLIRKLKLWFLSSKTVKISARSISIHIHWIRSLPKTAKCWNGFVTRLRKLSNQNYSKIKKVWIFNRSTLFIFIENLLFSSQIRNAFFI